jgi:hypothetical protein
VCGVGREHSESRQAGPPIVASVPRIRPVSDAAIDDAALDACGAVETVDGAEAASGDRQDEKRCSEACGSPHMNLTLNGAVQFRSPSLHAR